MIMVLSFCNAILSFIMFVSDTRNSPKILKPPPSIRRQFNACSATWLLLTSVTFDNKRGSSDGLPSGVRARCTTTSLPDVEG